MRVTTPPRLGGTGAALDGWGIRRAAGLRFDRPAALAADPAHAARLAVYTDDMLRPYGQRLAPGAVDHGRGQSYGEMAEAVLGRLVGPDDDVDVLVLAYAVPDITPGRATAVYLSHVCPGQPMAFALCDQGTGAAFTGLRLIRDYASTGLRRAVLLVVEQAELPYDAGDAAVPAVHAAVGFLFGDGDAVLRVDPVRQHPGAPATAFDATGADTVVLGAALAGAATGGARVRLAPAGQPYTGVWWALAEEIDDGAPGRVVVADYDTGLRHLSVAAVERVAAVGRVAAAVPVAG